MEPSENEMKDEYLRLKSFPKEWSSSYRHSKGDLAKNGVYFKESQCVTFCCDKSIPSINSTDLANLHSQINPNCNFLTDNKTNGNIPLPLILNYNWEKHRLVTFLRTSWVAPVDPNDLAKWGFYFTGQTDVARCFVCRLEVRGWEPGDTGEGEHKKWNPNCPFIKNLEVSGNVPLGAEVNLDPNAVPQYANGIIHTGSEIVIPENVLCLASAIHPRFTLRSARVATFEMWPMALAQRPGSLADAGFFYSGRSDITTCYHCGNTLHDWGAADQPWVEHAAFFPSCEYLKVMKGQEFVDRCGKLKNVPSRSAEPAQTDLYCHEVIPLTPEQQRRPQPHNNLAVGVPEEQDMDEAAGGEDEEAAAREAIRKMRSCKVCFVKELGVVFLPCGHMATCPDCAPQLTECPTCRSKATAYVRAYLP